MKSFVYYLFVLWLLVTQTSLMSCSKDDDPLENQPNKENQNNNEEENKPDQKPEENPSTGKFTYAFGDCTVNNSTLSVPFTIENGTDKDHTINFDSNSAENWVYDEWGQQYNFVFELEQMTIPTKGKVSGALKIQEFQDESAMLNFHIQLGDTIKLEQLEKKVIGRVPLVPNEEIGSDQKIIDGIEFTTLKCEVDGEAASIYYRITNKNDKTVSFTVMGTSKNAIVYGYQQSSWIYDDWGYRYYAKNRLGSQDNKNDIYLKIPANLSMYGRLYFKDLRTQSSKLSYSLLTSLSNNYRLDNIELPGRISSLPQNDLNMSKTVDDVEMTVLSAKVDETACAIQYKIKNLSNGKLLSLDGGKNTSIDYSYSWFIDDWGYTYPNTLNSFGNETNSKIGVSQYLPKDLELYGELVINNFNSKSAIINVEFLTNLSRSLRVDNIPIEGRDSQLPSGKASYEIVNNQTNFDINIVSCTRSSDIVTIVYNVINKDTKLNSFSVFSSHMTVTNQDGEKWSSFSINSSIGDGKGYAEIPYNIQVWGKIVLRGVKSTSKQVNIKYSDSNSLWEIKNLLIE